MHTTPATALDVAEYLLEKAGPLEALKLQKLVYYSQAWSLVWEGSPAFNEEVQAWIHGPVVPELYQMHAHQTEVLAVGGHSERVSDATRACVNEVLLYYGHKSGTELRALTHAEGPWRNARGDTPENMPSTEPISRETMRSFYAGRPCGGGEPFTDVSCFSESRVRESRRELEAGKFGGLESLRSGT